MSSIDSLDNNSLDLLGLRADALNEWGQPDWSILDDRRGNLPEFPITALSANLQAYIERAARGAGVTPAHVAIPLLSIASGIVGTSRRVQAARGWTEPLSIWTALVGFSGTGKTPGIGVTKTALAQIERNRRDKIADLERQHETKVEAAKALHKQWLKAVEEATTGNLPPPPMPPGAAKVGPFVPPRTYVTDATIEKLAVLLQGRPAGMQVISDELAGLFANMGRYSNGSDREFWLEAWNGKSHTVERMGRPPVMLEHLLVGITGGLQPDKLERAFGGDNDGMYARLCFAWPSEPGYRPLSNDVSEVEPEIINALERLVRIAEPDSDGVFAPRAIPLSPDAAATFEHFRQFLHSQKEFLEDKELEWWAKGGTQVLRIAGTIALLSWAWESAASEPNQIDASFVEAAILVWRDYLWPHSSAALRQVGLNRSHDNMRKALRWIFANAKDQVSIMDIRRHALQGRLNAKDTETLFDGLAKLRWLKKERSETGGRPADRWKVSPFLLSRAETAETAESSLADTLPALSAVPAVPAGGGRQAIFARPNGRKGKYALGAFA